MDATKHPFQLINAFLFFFHQDHKKKKSICFRFLHISISILNALLIS